MSKSKSNLIFSPVILYKALGQCRESYSGPWNYNCGILPALLWKTAPEPFFCFLLSLQRQRKLRTSGCYICYIKAVSATSRMTSGPAKGLRRRSHLWGILFQLDRKPRQNFTQENLPYCPLCPSVVTFYQFLWIHLQNTIQWAECFTLHSEVCNPPAGAAHQQLLQEVPEHEPWCPPDGG